MKKRRKTERIYIYIRIPANRGTRWFDRFLPLRFESSLPAKGDPGTNEKPPSPRCRFSSPRIDRAGERSSGTPKEESRCKTWLRSNTIPLPPSSEIANSFSARGEPNHPGNTLLWLWFVRRASIFPPIRACVRACVGRRPRRWRCARESCATANLDAHASSHVFMNVCGYVWERIAEIRIFSKHSRLETRAWEREREGERYEVAEGRGERAERVLRQQRERKRFVLSLKRFFFESNGAALSESGR